MIDNIGSHLQVIKEWKRRNGAEYVETIPDCELVPNQTYRLSGRPETVIEPEVHFNYFHLLLFNYFHLLQFSYFHLLLFN